MKKHKFNIFPDLSPEEYKNTLDDIRTKGYDSSFPIVTYQGDIIDGWNRQRICDEIGVIPTYRVFEGSDAEAIEYIMRSNKRRSLKKGQWACLAAEADVLIAAISADVEKSRREKQAETQSRDGDLSDKKLSDSQDDHADKTATKLSELFNTNRTYVNQAVRLKKENFEQFERVKSGEIPMSKALRGDARIARREKDFLEAVKKLGMEDEVAKGDFSRRKKKVIDAAMNVIPEIAEMKRIGEIAFAICAKIAKMSKSEQKKAFLGGVYGVNKALGSDKKSRAGGESKVKEHIPTDGKSCAIMAIIKLDRILDNDSEFEWAMNHIIAYCQKRINTNTNKQ